MRISATDKPQNSQMMAILGPDGKPANLSPSMRHEELMGSFDSFLAISFRLAPFNPDALIQSKGYTLLDDELNMACVRAPLDAIRDAVMSKGVTVQAWMPPGAEVAPPEAQELATALQYALDNIEDKAGNPQTIDDVVYEILLGIHYGFNVTEMGWKFDEEPGSVTNGKLIWSGFAAKPCRQIGFDVDTQTLAVNNLTSYTPLGGYQFDIPVEKCLRWTHRGSVLPYGTSIGRVVYRDFWTIELLMRLRNLALETFGSPFLVGHGPANQIPDIRKTLSQVRAGAPPAFADNVTVDLMQVAAGGLASFDNAIDSEREQCALAYLHSTLTTGTASAGTNTNALGNVHADTSDNGHAYFRRQMEFVLNKQMVRRWVRYNYGAAALRYAPVCSLGDWDEADAEAWSGAVTKLIGSDVLHPDEPQIRQKLKLAPMDPKLKADQKANRARKIQQQTDKAKGLGSVPPKGKN